MPALVAVIDRAWARHQAHKLAGRSGIANTEARGRQHKTGALAAAAARSDRPAQALVFTDDEGRELVRYDRSGSRHAMPDVYFRWRAATEQAGVPGTYFHDLRRTAARNLIRAGVSEQHAMRLLGHKTRVMFQRYNIIDRRDLDAAMARLAAASPAARRA